MTELGSGKFAGRDEVPVVSGPSPPQVCVLDNRRPGQRALVTGASSGIGKCFAENLAAMGWNLTLVSRDVARLTALQATLKDAHGVDVTVFPADLVKGDDIRRVGSALASDDSIDLLINNAGVSSVSPVVAAGLDDLDAMLQLNAVAVVLLARAVLPGMVARNRGAIVNVSSAGAFVCVPMSATYCASKALVSSFTEALSGEVADTNVQVQALCPGMTLTELAERGGFDVSWVSSWMTAQEVVDCCFAGLRMGEIVCVPGLHDTNLITEMRAAGAGVVGQTIDSKVAGRYRATIEA